MALAFDAFSSGSTLPGNSITMAHTCTGSNLILIVGISSNNADTVTGVTYNGVAMTLGKKSSVTGPVTYMYYLIAPATGAHNIVISGTGSEFWRAVGASYTGARQSSQPDQSAENRVTNTAITTTLTQAVTNAWQVGIMANSGSGTGSAGSGVGSVRGNVGNIIYIGDSNTTTAAGTRTLTWNNTTNTQLDALQLSIADVTQPAPAGFFGLF